MSYLLPPTIVLYSKEFSSHLNYSEDSDSETHGFLKFKNATLFSPLAKFEVVPAKSRTGLVHIKCSHSKKFLRRRNQNAMLLSPEADSAEEGENLWSCTLFDPVVTDDGQTMFLHIKNQIFARAWQEVGGVFLKLDPLPTEQSKFQIIDLETVVKLPKHVTFKGHNGKYLQHEDHTHLRFTSTDKGIPQSWFKVSTDGYGMVQIKTYDKYADEKEERHFAEEDDGAIWCTGSSSNIATFWPVKVDSKTVAFICNNKFLAQTSVHGREDSLKAAYTSIATSSRFTVEELVLSRRIYYTEFDLENAIIYGETPVTMATVNASNNTSEDNDMEFKFAYTESKSSTWTASHSWMVGIEVSGSLKIPFIADGEVTFKGEYSGSYEWGETVTSSSTLETTYKVKVPKNTSVSVSLIATQGTCNVPFSYYQKDVLYNGQTVVYKKEDGLYKGVNSYKFRYEATARKEPISIANLLDPSVDPTTEQMLPDPFVDPTIEQMIPMPVPPGSTTRVQNKVTSITSPEQELSLLQLEDAAALP